MEYVAYVAYSTNYTVIHYILERHATMQVKKITAVEYNAPSKPIVKMTRDMHIMCGESNSDKFFKNIARSSN